MNTNIGNSMAAGFNQQGLELAMRQCEFCDYNADLYRNAEPPMMCCS
jgi:hypothetical protein